MRGRGAVPGRLRRSPPPGALWGWATLRLGAGYGYYVGAGLRARTARARVCVRSASLLGGCVCVSRLYTLRFTLSVTVWQEPPCTHRVQGRVRVGAVGEGVASEAWPRGRQTAGGRPARPRAHWLPASPRATRSAPMAIGVGALRARVPEAAGSLPRATRSAPKAWALRARAPTCVLSPGCTRCLLGMVLRDVDDVVRCALLERLGARRASSSCRGRGWGGTPRGSEIGNRPRTRRRNSETPSERGRP